MVEIKFKDIEKEQYDQMFKWCREQFGREALWASQLDIPDSPAIWYSSSSYPKQGGTGGMFGSFGGGTPSDRGNVRFAFRDDRNATLFSLRWSEQKK